MAVYLWRFTNLLLLRYRLLSNLCVRNNTVLWT